MKTEALKHVSGKTDEKLLNLNSQQRAAAPLYHGPWAIYPRYAQEMVALLKMNGIEAFQIKNQEVTQATQAVTDQENYIEERQHGMSWMLTKDGIAVLPLHGPFAKNGGMSFSGVVTTHARRVVRTIAQDQRVHGIMLHISSPGGQVYQTMELAQAVASIQKPVHAYIEDLGASAAYWVSSQTDSISANTMAQVGSIGTLLVLADRSEMAEKAGVKVHVISTGDYKGSGVDGSPITDKHKAYYQDMVNAINEHFLTAVSQGREMTRAKVDEIADGRVHMAKAALDMGLIDHVETFEQAVNRLRQNIKTQPAQARARAESAPPIQTQETQAEPADNPTPAQEADNAQETDMSEEQNSAGIPLATTKWMRENLPDSTADMREHCTDKEMNQVEASQYILTALRTQDQKDFEAKTKAAQEEAQQKSSAASANHGLDEKDMPDTSATSAEIAAHPFDASVKQIMKDESIDRSQAMIKAAKLDQAAYQDWQKAHNSRYTPREAG